MHNRLFVVIPCYNEEEMLPVTAERLEKKLKALTEKGLVASDSRVLLVNDGSRDRTWEVIEALHAKNPLFRGLDLSRNRGHQNALLAGLMTARAEADCTVSMDADLQDDLDAMDEMLEKYRDGCEIVYGVRSSRKRDSFFKRTTAEGFYRLMRLMGVELVFNHADYRLMSRRALEGLAAFRESNLFLRGIIPMIGYRTDTVFYERQERLLGESKYPLRRMLSLAWEGITSLSIRPIRIITWIGLLVFLVSLVMLIYSLCRFFAGETVVGWASVMISVWVLGGLMLLSIGVVGEYIGKIYLETKRRPRFLIREYLTEEKTDGEANDL